MWVMTGTNYLLIASYAVLFLFWGLANFVVIPLFLNFLTTTVRSLLYPSCGPVTVMLTVVYRIHVY